MKILHDVMLDIETLGNTPNSAIIQISMVYFDRISGRTGRRMKVNISPKSSKYYGLVTCKSTIDWWNSSDDLKRQFNGIVNGHTVSLKEALKRVTNFLTPGSIIWSHNNFDIPILQYSFIATGNKIPWNYKNTRDIRTLTDLAKLNLNKLNWNNKTHDSMDDVEFQIDYCVKCFRKLKLQSLIRCIFIAILFILMLGVIFSVRS